METPRERPPTRLRVVCQEGWDGARRHPQPAAGVQSAEQWCSSQPQPQLRYQHGSGTGHAALSSWPVADQNRRSRNFQQNQQLAAWQMDSQPQQRNGYTAAWQEEFQPQQCAAPYSCTAYGYAEDFNGHRADEGHWPRAENEHERAAQRWQDACAAEECAHARRILQLFSGGQADEGWQRAESENERAAQRWQDARAAEERAHSAEARRVADAQRAHGDACAAEECAHAAEARRVTDAQRAHEDVRAAEERAHAAAEARHFADAQRAHEDARAQDAPAAAERARAARDARHARHAREAAVAADDESTGKPEQRAVNEPVSELEQPYGLIGHQPQPEWRVAIGIAAAAKPGGEQVEPEQQAAPNEPEQRAAITIAAEPGSAETALFEPEQHAAANEPEQRAAITIAAEPGSAPVEPKQHAAADEPPPPLAPQPGELSEREVDYTVAAQPGGVLGLGHPAVSATADPDPEGLGPSAPLELEMAINAPTSRSSRTRLRRLARARASARAAAADAVASRANTNAAAPRVARAPNVRAVAQCRPRPRGRGGDAAAIRIAPESSGAPLGTGVDAPPTWGTRSRRAARTLARAAAAAALASGAETDVSTPRVGLTRSQRPREAQGPGLVAPRASSAQGARSVRARRASNRQGFAQKRFHRRQRCFVQICTKRRHFTVSFTKLQRCFRTLSQTLVGCCLVCRTLSHGKLVGWVPFHRTPPPPRSPAPARSRNSPSSEASSKQNAILI